MCFVWENNFPDFLPFEKAFKLFIYIFFEKVTHEMYKFVKAYFFILTCKSLQTLLDNLQCKCVLRGLTTWINSIINGNVNDETKPKQTKILFK